ncbi:MAG TPA: hypothetical protein VE954_43130 [Oligoflexus sp.]|uniref:hypothetical protein n=1 Tax=Oligoflexus sp. TaxID=1971216 RepID=UPI002D4C4C76|nr:hypothetical protein [Oligoflexus sp.]HYX39938.1 hypothetical protein [Oligoflexus sp.]
MGGFLDPFLAQLFGQQAQAAQAAKAAPVSQVPLVMNPNYKAPAPAVIMPNPKTVPPVSLPGNPAASIPKGEDGPVTLEDIHAAAVKLGILGQESAEAPKFDISDLMGKRDEMAEVMKAMPYDVRPLANLMDTIYGTKSSQMTPDIQAEFLNKIKAAQGIMGEGAALQQVKGQARLEEFKQKLGQALNPADQALVLERLGKALGRARGGTSEGMDWKQKVYNDKEFDENEEREYRADKDDTDKLEKLQTQFENRDSVKNYKKSKVSADKLRGLVYKPTRTGVPDYASIILFIKNLDPESTVMFNEAASLGKAEGLFSKLKQIPDNLVNGTTLTPGQIRDMLKAMDIMEDQSRRTYRQERSSYIKKGQTNRLRNPEDVVLPTDASAADRERYYLYLHPDGKNKIRIPRSDRTKFEDENQKMLDSGTMRRLGIEEKDED